MPHPSPIMSDSHVDLRQSTRSALRVRMREALPDMAALGLLFALAFSLLARQIIVGGTFYNDDIVYQSIPVYSWYADGLKQGRIPIWSASILGGFPLAFAQYGFFYPPDMLLFWLLDAARAFHLSLALHLALAGWCTYWYCRVLGMRRLPSLFAAVVFQMGNEVLSWPANGFITRTLFAIPATLATIELLFRRSPRFWLLIPLVVGSALLGGYAQILLFALTVAGAYALVIGLAYRRTLGAKETAHRLILLALGVALGFGLAAVRVLPTLLVTAESTRAGGLPLDRSAVDSIEPWALLAGYLLPAILEVPGTTSARPDYLGAPALLLAALPLVLARLKDRIAGFHLGLAALSTTLSLGTSTPLYGMLFQLPFFSLFRGPNRFSLVAALAIAVLAAYALDRRLALDLVLRKRLLRATVATGIIALTAGLSLAVVSVAFQFGRDPFSDYVRRVVEQQGWDTLNALRPRVAFPLISAFATPFLAVAAARLSVSHRVLEWWVLFLSTATLFLLGWVHNPWLQPNALYEAPVLLNTLKNDPDRFRVFSYAPAMSVYNVGVYYTDKVGSPPSTEFQERYLRQFIAPNLGMLFDVATPGGYEVLQTRRQALVGFYMGSDRTEYARYSDGDWVDWNLHNASLSDRLSFLAALNVKYLLHPFLIEDPRLELRDEVEVQIYPGLPAVAKVHLYQLKDSQPRAFLVPTAVTMPSEKQVLDTLFSGSVNLHEAVILESTPAAMEGPPLTAAGSWVEITAYRDDHVSLRAHTNGNGFLVLMDFLLPGWSATVNSNPEPILAGNFAGRAVPIRSAGDHRIDFHYEAPLLREGLAVSLLSLALLLLGALHSVALVQRRAT